MFPLYLRLFKQLHKMEKRAAKLRKLNDFRRSLPHVSARALDQIFKGIQEQGLPDLMTRDQMREATNELMTSVTPHGPLIVEIELNMIDGTVIHDLAVNPIPCIQDRRAFPSNVGWLHCRWAWHCR